MAQDGAARRERIVAPCAGIFGVQGRDVEQVVPGRVVPPAPGERAALLTGRRLKPGGRGARVGAQAARVGRAQPLEPARQVAQKGQPCGIGIAQAAALLPGISRSGATISTALFLGIRQEEAARFSFLMVLPLIAAATGMEILELVELGVSTHEWGLLITGLVVSFITGWISLRWLLTLLKKGQFHYFAWYCFAIALSAIVYFS